jgi:IS1 family transposase/transposase-like protein
MVTILVTCRHCGSSDLIKYGLAPNGKQKYRCRTCGRQSRENPDSAAYSAERKEEILRAYQERSSLRGLERTFGVARSTVISWLKKKARDLPPLRKTLIPPDPNDPTATVLELDELWSFVCKKLNQVWIWFALCRKTRQIVAFVLGDRDEATCRKLWRAIPLAYRRGTCYTDFWKAYQAVIPAKQHRPVGKETGETAHIERFNNTLRQRLARFVRKTLSFSKSRLMHEICLRLFVLRYNTAIRHKHMRMSGM